MANKAGVKGELVVDERGRASLARVRSRNDITRYEVEEFPGGVLVLIPIVSVRESDLPADVRAKLRKEDR
jgi:hypothetical protein